MLIHCCILLDFLYELYYDARIHEQQHQADVFCFIKCILLIFKSMECRKMHDVNNIKFTGMLPQSL